MKLFPERERCLQIGDAEKLYVVGQRFGNSHQAVAVSVRFDYREHFSFPDSISHDLRVVPQRSPIDLSPATMIVCHFLGIVMCGSRKYIGSSGGCSKFFFGSVARRARTVADG